jgi:uncharacterized protein involved in exopolysaccharide biosynthesis
VTVHAPIAAAPTRLEHKISDYRLRAEAAERAERDTALELGRVKRELAAAQARISELEEELESPSRRTRCRMTADSARPFATPIE